MIKLIKESIKEVLNGKRLLYFTRDRRVAPRP